MKLSHLPLVYFLFVDKNSVSINFHHCDKIPDRNSYRSERLILAQFLRVSYGGEGEVWR